MQLFVSEDSIVRTIWGKSDTVLFIFAGASAEFALNKAVDWLYFTGRLPADPLGRLFSTVSYARKIVFSPTKQANAAIDSLRQIHATVEHNRGFAIPDWAYRDVLFMLIHYSIAAFEVLERKLSEEEKEEVFNVFYRVGDRMGLKELPLDYKSWLPERESHLQADLQKSDLTTDLFKQYRKHLGVVRYKVLIESQKLVVPSIVAQMLNFGKFSILSVAVPVYKFARLINLDGLLKGVLFPSKYKKQIHALDVKPKNYNG